MTIGGWIFMFLSVGGVTLFFVWSMSVVLTRKSAPERLHSTIEETPDMDEEC
jgi:hypothetical protein